MREDLVFNHYSKILDKLLNDAVFAFVFQEPREFMEDFNFFSYEKMPDNLFLNFGATRFCLIDENYPYVVKVDYLNPEFRFRDFDSFCEKEKFLYEKAQERNLDKYLTEVKYLGTYYKKINFYDLNDILDYYLPGIDEFDYSSYQKAINDLKTDQVPKKEIEIVLPLYGYERADKVCLNEKDNKTFSYLSNSPLSERAHSITVRFIQDYGLEEFYDFNDFLQEYNVSDIHKGNIGEIYGKIVLLDYAGYPLEYDTEFD